MTRENDEIAKRLASARERTPPVALKLADLFDSAVLQSMMDDFYALTHIPMALIGLEGEVFVGAGWQDVCTQFHRVNPDTCAHCIESDTVLTADIPVGEARLYRCRNGMWDGATPIVVGEARVANLFTGQFFFDDEPVDMEFFRGQALRYGFDEQEYLAAIDRVPRLSRATVDMGLRFLKNLSNMISQLSFSNIARSQVETRLRDALGSQTELTKRVAEERRVLQATMESTDAHLAYLDPDFNFVLVNSTYARGSGHTSAELIGRNHFDLFPDEENQAIFERARETGEPVEFRAKPFEFADQPWRGVTYWDWRLTPIKDADGRLRGFAFSLQDVTRTVRETAFSDAINRLNEIIHSDLDFGSILAQFVPELARVTGTEVVNVMLRSDDGRWRFREVYGLPDEVKGRAFSDEDVPAAVKAIQTGQPVTIGGDENDAPTTPLAAELHIRSLLIAPLVVGGRQLGVMSYGYLSGPGTFDDASVDFSGKIAASLSLALQNSRLFETEHTIADRLQGALLALPEHVEGIEFAHSYHSATDAARVGGDFYDLFELDEHHVGVTIGDVAGKGLDAAVMTSMVKNTIRAHASESGKTPGRILGLTNDVVYRATPPDAFVTVFFGVLDRRDGRIVHANAGHTTAALVRGDGTVDRLPVTGPLLGAFPEMSFDQSETRLGDDDLLFLYTDGLSEARRDGQLYGEERLFELLASMGSAPAADVVRDVTADVVKFSEDRLRDDLAILGIKRSR